MSRPRRNIQTISYTESLDSESFDPRDSEQTADAEDSAHEDVQVIESRREEITFTHNAHYLLSTAEREAVEMAVAEAKSRLLSVSQEEARIVRNIEKMQSSIVTLKKKLDKHCRSLARVGFLPRDILATIFVLVHDPWPLIRVNRWWRRVACTTTRLWTDIYAAFGPLYHISTKERISCRKPEQLEFVLQNAQGAELDLELHLCSQQCLQKNQDKKSSDADHNAKMLSLLKTLDVYRQIRNLEVDRDTSRILGEISLDGGSFSTIRSLNVEGISTSFQHRVSVDTPRLSELTLRGSGLAVDEIFIRWMQSNPISLRQLCVVTMHFEDSRSFVRGISSLYSLRVLVLRGTHIAFPTSIPSSIDFTSLERLELVNATLSWPNMSFPKLTNLVMTRSTLLSEGTNPVSLPKLINLVSEYQPPQDRTDFLCPMLRTLNISFSYGWHSRINITNIINTVDSLQSLTVYGSRGWYTTHFLLSQSCFRRLKQLKILDPLRKEFYEALAGCRMGRDAPTARKSNPKKMLCRELESLEIDYQAIHTKTYDNSLRLWGTPAFSLRQSSVHALQSLKVRYMGEEDWVSF